MRGWQPGCLVAGCHSTSSWSSSSGGDDYDSEFKQLLWIVRDKAQTQNRIEERAAKYHGLLALSREFGLTGSLMGLGYAGGGGYGLGYGQPYAQQGGTAYGYQGQLGQYGQPAVSFGAGSAYSESWGPQVDYMQLLVMLGNSADAWRSAGVDFGKLHGETIRDALKTANEVERSKATIAQGEAAAKTIAAAAEVAKATKPNPPPDQTTTVQTQVGPGGASQSFSRSKSSPLTTHHSPPPFDSTAAINGLLALKCAACHSGENPKAGLDLSHWQTFSPDEWQIILDVTDPAKTPADKLMPKGQSPLTNQEHGLLKLHKPAPPQARE